MAQQNSDDVVEETPIGPSNETAAEADESSLHKSLFSLKDFRNDSITLVESIKSKASSTITTLANM